jgi:hypothetical protein
MIRQAAFIWLANEHKMINFQWIDDVIAVHPNTCLEATQKGSEEQCNISTVEYRKKQSGEVRKAREPARRPIERQRKQGR